MRPLFANITFWLVGFVLETPGLPSEAKVNKIHTGTVVLDLRQLELERIPERSGR